MSRMNTTQSIVYDMYVFSIITIVYSNSNRTGLLVMELEGGSRLKAALKELKSSK